MTTSCAETLPTASVFLEAGLISSIKASPSLFLSHRFAHHASFIPLLGTETTWAHTQGSSAEDEKVAGIFQLGLFKTTVGTTKCVLLICICDIFEAELPLRCIFSRTTFSHVRREITVNHMCGREKPVGYVQYSLPLCLASLSPSPPPTHFINGFCNYW